LALSLNPKGNIDGQRDSWDARCQGINSASEMALKVPQVNYRFRADQGGAQYWSATADDCAVPGCTGVTVTLSAASDMAPKGLLSSTAYQPGSDTALIQAS